MTVENVRRLYRIPPDYRAPHVKGNRQAVANFLGISVNPKDTNMFLDLMGSPPQQQTKFVGPGKNNPDTFLDPEGSIDLQWIQGIGQGVETEYWNTDGGQGGHEPFLDWIVGVGNTSHPALVHSLSYGENEVSYADEYKARVDLEFMKLGLRGVTVLIATGDTGIQGAAQPGGAPPSCYPFHSIFPASSPHVTSVGATQFSTHVSPICDVENVYSMGTSSSIPFSCPDDDVGEITCSTDTGAMITSGGGFSNYFSRPWYQDHAVKWYHHDCADQPGCTPRDGSYNLTGRGFPDIAAIGQNVPTIFNGTLVMVGGTSAAAPIAAGLISLLNAELLRLGRPSLGFMNPWLYSLAQQFPDSITDVRSGNNSGGNRLLPTYVSCESGFRSIPGWDPATGLGSLNFERMLAHLLPPGASSLSAPTSHSGKGPSPVPDIDGGGVGMATEMVVVLCAVCSLVSAIAVAVVGRMCDQKGRGGGDGGGSGRGGGDGRRGSRSQVSGGGSMHSPLLGSEAEGSVQGGMGVGGGVVVGNG